MGSRGGARRCFASRRLGPGPSGPVVKAPLSQSALNRPRWPSAVAHPALAHVERGIVEMRSDPEASKRDADEALRLLQQQPDADLEVRARG